MTLIEQFDEGMLLVLVKYYRYAKKDYIYLRANCNPCQCDVCESSTCKGSGEAAQGSYISGNRGNSRARTRPGDAGRHRAPGVLLLGAARLSARVSGGRLVPGRARTTDDQQLI